MAKQHRGMSRTGFGWAHARIALSPRWNHPPVFLSVVAVAGVEPPLPVVPLLAVFLACMFVVIRSACTPRRDHDPLTVGAPVPADGKKWMLSFGFGGVCDPKRSASCACETAGEGKNEGRGDAAAPRSAARSDS